MLIQNKPASGTDINSSELVAGVGAVVAMVSATSEFPLPGPTWVGLKLQVVRLGRFEQAKVTSLGKLPVTGFTSTVKVVDLPTGTEADCGFTPKVKSKLCVGRTVSVTGAEWVIGAGSLPTALMLKLKLFEIVLLALTVNAPDAEGVRLAGLAEHCGGALVPQLNVTGLLYPFKAVSVPLKTAVLFT